MMSCLANLLLGEFEHLDGANAANYETWGILALADGLVYVALHGASAFCMHLNESINVSDG